MTSQPHDGAGVPYGLSKGGIGRSNLTGASMERAVDRQLATPPIDPSKGRMRIEMIYQRMFDGEKPEPQPKGKKRKRKRRRR